MDVKDSKHPAQHNAKSAPERKESEGPRNPNVIFIGKKPLMNYVLAVVTQLNAGSDEVIIKARGMSISRAVDVAEIVRNRFLVGSKVKDIKIGTEVLTREDGTNTKVSSIEIFMSK